MMPKISVITVAYNAAETIERTICSVIDQHYPNVEYIIIDGGSTDQTVDIIRKYENHIHYWVSEKDNGIYDAMNKGIINATGDVIGILNSDDRYEPSCLNIVAECFDKDDTDIVYGDIKTDDGFLIRIPKPMQLNQVWLDMVVPHPAMFVKREIYNELGLYDTSYRIAADYDFVLKSYTLQKRFTHISKPLTIFSLGGISSTNRSLSKSEAETVKEKYVNDEILRAIFEKLLDKSLVIHGAGYWGTWLINNVVRLYTNDIIWIDREADNTCNRTECGITLRPLDAIDENRQIVVAVYECSEIKEEYRTRGLRVVTIKKLINLYTDLLYEHHCHHDWQNCLESID